MKVLLLRMGALGTMVLLGWIAMAQAQRGRDEAADDESGTSVAVSPGAPRPTLDPPSGEVNPLRPAQPQSRALSAPRSERTGGRPSGDPFGLRDRYPATRTSSTSTETSAPADGPAFSSDNRDNNYRARGDRYASRPAARARTPAYADDRYAKPAGGGASGVDAGQAGSPSYTRSTGPGMEAGNRGDSPRRLEGQEPAPFRADPFAMPANSTRGKRDNAYSPPLSGSPSPSLTAESEGTGQPGASQLEGIQSPQLSIQKLAPKEIQVGMPAKFRIAVRNTGSIIANQVEVRDQVPRGTRLINTAPQAKRGPSGELLWTLGTIRPGEESAVEIELMPLTEGEIGSVATVHFGAEASVRTVATRPQLAIEATVPEKVMIGEQVVLSIVISNPGTGVATRVVLEERIPPGLQHPAGSELEYAVGELRPGESRKLDLPLVAARPGPVTNVLVAHGDGNLHAEDKRELEVIAPQLDVVMEGPKRRYLERQATYQLSVSNPGTAPARQVELIASLPPGLKFLSANNAGYYEESTRTVRWRLEELPARETGSVELVTMPIEPGQHAIKLRGTAQKGLLVEREQPVLVEGIAAILFQVGHTVDPVEVGGETVYEVRVTNQGSKSAGNVRVTALLPPELQPVAAEGPTRYSLEGNRVVFEGLGQLAPKGDSTFRVRVKALRAGDLRARFQLLTDDMQSPVTKEESTRVYADE